MGEKTASTQPTLPNKPMSLATATQQSLFATALMRPGVIPASQMRRSTVQMSASHGLNKNDKKFIRKMNEKLYKEGTSENLTH